MNQQENKRPYKKKTEIDNVASAATEVGHTPPQAADVEEAVLGSMMIEADSVPDVLEVLTSKSFYVPKNRLVFEAIQKLYNEKEAVDLITITEKLRQMKVIDEIGGAVRLADLTQRVGSASHIEYYTKILQQKTIQRDLIDASYGILKDAFDESTNVDLLIESSQSRVFNAVKGNMKTEYKHIGDVVNRSMDRIQQMQETKGLTGIPSGFQSLDSYTMGWQNSNLIILGARPSVGKTAFALNMARNAAVRFNIPTAFFSLEMADIEISDRLIATESGLGSNKLKGKEKMTGDDWARLEGTLTKLVKAPLFIDETPGITISEFSTKAKRLVREHKVQIIFVDYLQLMHASAQQASYREQEVSAISQALKATAKELNIPIIALAQLNRNIMNRQGSNGRPVLSDLRDSGSIEQDADMVIFIHRPGMYGLEEDLSRTEVIIAKHRNGETGIIEMTYNGDQVKFIDEADSLSAYSQSFQSRMNDTRDVTTMPNTDFNPFDSQMSGEPPWDTSL